MALNYPTFHEGYVPAYQMSALPYVTASQISLGEVQEFAFEHVTRFINVKNCGSIDTDKIAVAFTQRGFEVGNYFTVDAGVSFRDEIRCDRIFISGSAGTNVDFELVMGISPIPRKQFNTITGSLGYQGVG